VAWLPAADGWGWLQADKEFTRRVKKITRAMNLRWFMVIFTNLHQSRQKTFGAFSARADPGDQAESEHESGQNVQDEFERVERTMRLHVNRDFSER
jgi:hypothetical protein